jgi:hypothetical protein
VGHIVVTILDYHSCVNFTSFLSSWSQKLYHRSSFLSSEVCWWNSHVRCVTVFFFNWLLQSLFVDLGLP